MVELALYGLVEVCLFSSLLGFFCRFHREGVFAFLVGAGLEVQESCLFIVVVEFLEYTLFVAFPECICWDSLESVTASWLVLILSSIHFLHSGGWTWKICFFAYLFCRVYPVFFPVSFFCIVPESFLFRIIFHHFSVPNRTITRCLGKISFVFPSVSPAVVSCFCTKLFGICTKQDIFCTKTGGNSGMFFQHFRDLFMRIADFFAFFSWLFRWKNPFFFKSDRPSMTEFIPIGRISFMLFSDDSINFSASFPVHFCIFPSAYEKSAAFSIRIIRFLRFFRFVGIIFLAFSRAKLRNFSSHSRIFYASPEFFQKKNPLFSVPITQFRTCFSSSSG